MRLRRRRSSPDLRALQQTLAAGAADTTGAWPRAAKVRQFLLHQYSQVPAWLRDNPYIQGGYRVHFSWRLCLQSIFRLHNETLNVWTHLIGFFIFVLLMISMVSTVSPYGFDYFHLDRTVEVSSERLARYRQHFSQMVDSIRIRIPSWFEISKRLSVTGPTAVYLDALREKLTAIKDAVTGWCDHCSVRDIDRMRNSLTETVDNICESLPTDAVDSVRHLLLEIGSFLKAVRAEAAQFAAEFPNASFDAIAFLPRWPLAVFLGAAMACLLFSTIFHIFYCRSEQACTLLQQLDFAGICIMIAGSMVPAVYYGFYCLRFWQGLYLTMGICLPFLAFLAAMSKYLAGHRFRNVRAVIFASAGLVNLIPLCHLLFIRAGESRGLLLLVVGGVCYIVGAIFYSTQIPESIFPGKFDIWFHSHSIFHVFVVIAALTHYAALMRFFEWRMLNTCSVADAGAFRPNI
ncbi:unnamed protein product (mitochondrion) [Plasmodiophora brassicae]|uniref:Uncharacterized protein n=2 Tax=Plasmodiophora brassicae TaxID=37360 RepID=A0A3P3YHP2_PLABS|nr:unnamed protein product [Plasmodiophora brassicae]